MEKHFLKTKKTAKVCVIGELSSCKEVWIVLHGYGQLAQYFIKNFNELVSYNLAIIAPEALSRFYLNGSSGRVGASWMTKEERESDIKDYIEYLDQIVEEFELTSKKITVLGFSQGGATAARWCHQTKFKIERLIMWASLFPPELIENYSIEENKLQNSLLVFGTDDEYMSEEKLNKELKTNIFYANIMLIRFKGGHQIDTNTLINLA